MDRAKQDAILLAAAFTLDIALITIWAYANSSYYGL
jgi:hypothetical protein